MIRRASGLFVASLLALTVAASSADAQVTINGRVGLGVPTGGIADSDNSALGVGAKSGFAWGFGLGLDLSDRFNLRANFDRTTHKTEAGDATSGPDVNVNHYIAGLGYTVTDPANPFYVSVNLGAGAMTFDIQAEGAESDTYFAINAGAEIGYWLSNSVAIFASPQGDIAFTDKDKYGTSSAFVWPFTGGVKVKLGS
ncbi:MAG: porin family protein [Gemmatimonadota bacterium]|nr:porin family protein [Gemmatimonadota bacterium]